MCLDTIERANFLRFLCFFIDIGTDTLLQLFLHFVHQEDVVAFFSSDDVRKKCQELCSRNVLSKKQLSIINHSCPDIFSFDISLLITLLSNLFSGKIKPPIGGWEKNNPHGNEVAADIVRLRLLRNEVVGHSSRAKLSEGYFQELWERLETIILRLYSFLKPNSTCDISKQIDSYKTMNLDEQRERQYQEKLKTLQDACIEIVQIQDEVDDLLRKCKDFAQFFSTKRKRFSLYIKLLLDGGRLVLIAYLQKELSKRNITIQEVIVEKRAVLEKYSGDTETIQHLNEAVDKWVIGDLATVILVCFEDTVTPRIKEAITGIQDAFLGYARLALVSLNDDKFNDIYVDLVNNLRRLSLDLGSDIESKCEEFIDTYRRKKQENEPDTDDDFDLFKSHGLKMKELEDVYKETLIQLKKVITELEERGIPFKKDYVLQLQLMTYGEKKMFVEDILVTVITAILRHDESTSGSKDIWEALHLLLDQINNISGVKVESVERHCILISITCSSSLGLLKLIEYVESTLFQEMLYKLSTDLMAFFGEVLVVTGNFNFESLHDLANCLSSCFDTEHEPGGLTLHVTCSSVEGINQVVRLMKSDTTKHTVKQIAQHLSEQVQENVSLQIGFPDLQDFFREVGNNGTNLSSSQRKTAQSDPFSTNDGKDTTNPGKKSEEFGLQQENFVTTTKTEAEVCRASLASITQTTNELLSIQEQAHIDVVLKHEEAKKDIMLKQEEAEKNIYMRQGEVVKTVQDPADTCSSQLKRGDSELHGTDKTLELEIKSLDKVAAVLSCIKMDQELESCIQRLDDLTKKTLNDTVHDIYLQVGNKFFETLGYKEKAYLAGSTAEKTKLTTFKDRGDVDILFVTGKFEVSQEEFHEAGFPGYVWIRATDITKNLGLFELVDDEFISANTLREVKPELFSFLKSFYALQTAAVFGTPDKHDETAFTTLSKVGLSTNYYIDLTPPKLEGHTGVSKSHFQKPEDSNKLENFEPNEHDVQMIRKLAKGLRILLQPGGTGTDKSRLSIFAEALDDAIKQIKDWGEFLTSYPPSKDEQKKSSSTDDSNKPPSISTTCVATNHADYVTAVRIKGGVDHMKSWEKRVECQKWPPDEVKKEVRLSDVFLVARKSPQNPNIQKDFCLSFNQAEGILVRSFSSDQRRVYLIMKAYLKGTFTNMFTKEERDMKVKTFHVKTLLFWLFETEKEDLSENIPYILEKVLKFFREKMIERYLSHYFIPDANLLCEFKEEDYRIAIKCIDTVLKDPVERLEDFFKLTVDDGERIKIDLTPEEIACLATLSDDNGKSAAIDSIKTMIVEGHRGLREMTRDDNGKTNIKEAIMQAFRKYLELQIEDSLRQFAEKQMEKFLSCSDEEENDICFKLQKMADAFFVYRLNKEGNIEFFLKKFGEEQLEKFLVSFTIEEMAALLISFRP